MKFLVNLKYSTINSKLPINIKPISRNFKYNLQSRLSISNSCFTFYFKKVEHKIQNLIHITKSFGNIQQMLQTNYIAVNVFPDEIHLALQIGLSLIYLFL